MNNTRTRLLAIVAVVMLFPTLLVQAQDDPQQRHYLTWDDAPLTQPLRHSGDAQVHWGWEIPEVALGPFFQVPFQIGDHTTFKVEAPDDNQEFELRYRSEHAYFWFEVGATVDQETLETAAAYFDENIWPMDRYLYGDNATPGIDGDARIHIVHIAEMGPGLAGFFSPDDQCSTSICLESNQRDAIYIILDYGPINSSTYFSTVAHEFQHLIQFNIDGNEYRWMDEGLSQLAEHLNGFSSDPINQSNIENYLSQPNLQLNSWSWDYGEQSAYYGAGYLLNVYMFERFGTEFIRTLARNPHDGLAGINAALALTEQDISLNELIADWWIANYVDNPYVAAGQYYYQTFELSPRQVGTTRLNVGNQYRGLLHQYGVDYLEVNQGGTYTLSFTGDTETPLTLADPYSGDWTWWSYNSTASVTNLTRTVDLSDVTTATLEYNISGETGRFPGYLHVMVSTDGEEWEVLEGGLMDLFDYYGDAPGAHYAGFQLEWQSDHIDLSGYAGQEVQIRFEYITSNSIAGPGFMLDNISIPEIGWSDDVETLDEGWETNGFLRTQGVVEQEWLVSMITNEEVPQVYHFPVVAGKAKSQVEVPPGGAVIVVGAMAPFTPLQAQYSLSIN